MKMSPVKRWFLIAVLTAFPGVILLFNTNSYHADKNKINGLYLIVGVLLCLVALYSLWKANSIGNPGKPKR